MVKTSSKKTTSSWSTLFGIDDLPDSVESPLLQRYTTQPAPSITCSPKQKLFKNFKNCNHIQPKILKDTRLSNFCWEEGHAKSPNLPRFVEWPSWGWIPVDCWIPAHCYAFFDSGFQKVIQLVSHLASVGNCQMVQMQLQPYSSSIQQRCWESASPFTMKSSSGSVPRTGTLEVLEPPRGN